MVHDEFLWTERYRPKTVADTILPVRLKEIFQGFIDQKNVPHLILNGPQGIGKTSVARAVLEEIGADYILINASMYGNIDTLRNEIRDFASAVSITGARKYVILDEADNLNINSTQPALRSFMEEFAANCGFILTCNYKSKIMKELHSRCSVIDFIIHNDERAELCKQLFNRVVMILEKENINFDKKTVAAIVNKYSPDWRRVINELQSYSAKGAIDTGILANNVDTRFSPLITAIKSKNFSAIRVWVAENTDIDSSVLYRHLYDVVSTKMPPPSVAQMVILIAKYQYQEAFVADREINTVAALTEIMVNCTFEK